MEGERKRERTGSGAMTSSFLVCRFLGVGAEEAEVMAGNGGVAVGSGEGVAVLLFLDLFRKCDSSGAVSLKSA